MTLQEVGSFPKLNIFYKYSPDTVNPSVLRSGIAASGLVGFLVGIPTGGGISVYYECCVSSGRDVCIGLITSPDWCQ